MNSLNILAAFLLPTKHKGTQMAKIVGLQIASTAVPGGRAEDSRWAGSAAF